MVSLSVLWTEFPWNAATCLNERHWPSSFSVPGWSRSVRWPRLPQMYSLSEKPSATFGLCWHHWHFCTWTFSCLFFFFWIALVLLVPAFQRTQLIVSFSAVAIRPCSYQTQTIECTALFWLKEWVSLLWRNYKCEWETSRCQACTMLSLCPLKHLESHFR